MEFLQGFPGKQLSMIFSCRVSKVFSYRKFDSTIDLVDVLRRFSPCTTWRSKQRNSRITLVSAAHSVISEIVAEGDPDRCIVFRALQPADGSRPESGPGVLARPEVSCS